MSNTGLCKHCLSGSLHEGTPRGTYEEYAGTPTYVAPEPKTATRATVIFLCDVFGYKLPNVQLLADEFSRAGFSAIVPDIHQGDSMAPDSLSSVSNLDEMFAILGKWLPRHGPESVTSVIDPILEELKTRGQKIGLIGFCFGGRETFHYATTHKVQAVCAMHPSLINLPEDAQKIRVPISVHVAAKDEIYDADKSKVAEKIFKDNSIPYENSIYDGEGVVHGFACRADLSKPTAKKAKEDAISASLDWFQKFLV